MKLKSYIPTILLLAFNILMLNAQTDSTYNILLVEITESRLERFGSVGYKIIKVDEDALAENNFASLPDLLGNYPAAGFRQYGRANLATINTRGTGFERNALLWNGFKLESPMNGGIDLNLLPVSGMDKVSIQTGGASALFGSAAIGSTIFIENRIPGGDGFHFGLGSMFGSFKDFRQNVYCYHNYKNFANRFNISYTNAENNHPFIDTKGEKINIENAATNSLNVNFDHHYNFNEKHNIQFNAWYQNYNRDLPPTETAANTNARQEDENLRLGLNYNNVFTKGIWKTRIGFLQEQILFFSNNIDSSDSNVKSVILESELSYAVGKRSIFNIGIHQSFINAWATVFDENKKRNTSALFGSWRFAPNRKWITNLNIRQEITDQQFIPITFSLGQDIAITKHFQFNLNTSRNYRTPTFNDKFWPAGAFSQGNPDLKAEDSWNIESGFNYQQKINNYTLKANINAYSMWVNNWILWSPNQSNIWTPKNQLSVWSRGLETELSVAYTINEFNCSLAGGWHPGKVTHQKATVANENLAGKQLIFVPLQQGQITLRAAYRKIKFMYQHQFTGKRFQDTNNEKVLPAFNLGHIHISSDFKFTKMEMNLSANINNLWNTDYVVMPFRPMPLRHFAVAIQLKY